MLTINLPCRDEGDVDSGEQEEKKGGPKFWERKRAIQQPHKRMHNLRWESIGAYRKFKQALHVLKRPYNEKYAAHNLS